MEEGILEIVRDGENLLFAARIRLLTYDNNRYIIIM